MTSRTRTDEPPHECPGGCGRDVPHRLLACRDCWWLLPEEMRTQIRQARGRRRLQLVGEAVAWYRDHVVDAPEKKPMTITIDESWRPRR